MFIFHRTSFLPCSKCEWAKILVWMGVNGCEWKFSILKANGYQTLCKEEGTCYKQWIQLYIVYTKEAWGHTSTRDYLLRARSNGSLHSDFSESEEHTKSWENRENAREKNANQNLMVLMWTRQKPLWGGVGWGGVYKPPVTLTPP